MSNRPFGWKGRRAGAVLAVVLSALAAVATAEPVGYQFRHPVDLRLGAALDEPPAWNPGAGDLGTAFTGVPFGPVSIGGAVDPENKPVSYLVVSGPVPGLSLNSGTGALSGTPSTAGSYDPVVRATDGTQATDRTFHLQVVGPPVLALASGPIAVSGITGTSPGPCTSVTVTNSGGSAALSLSGPSFSGADAAHFESCAPPSGACGGTLAAGATCNLGIRLTSTGNGSYSSTALVSAAGGASASRPVMGTASGFCVAGSAVYSTPGDGTFAMPAGCRTLSVAMCGGGGGASGGATGGGAAYVTAQFAAIPGQTYRYTVAGGGQPTGAGGAGGGGNGYWGYYSHGAGGGGASWLYNPSGQFLSVAAGGGGSQGRKSWDIGGSSGRGGAGGQPGQGACAYQGICVNSGGTSYSGGAELCSPDAGNYGQPGRGGDGGGNAGGAHGGGGGGGGAWGGSGGGGGGCSGGGGNSVGQNVSPGSGQSPGGGCGGYGWGASRDSDSAGGNGFVSLSWSP